MSQKATVSLVSAIAFLIVSGLFAGAVHAAAPQQGLDVGRTVLEGAYSEAQAARGQAAYAKSCSACHGDSLQGYSGGYNGGGGNAPSLVGASFIDRWREDSLVDLYTYIRTSMPRQAEVSSVSDAVKVDIVAYILRGNGFPAGNAELSADALGTTLLVGKDGPKPLPSETTVWTVGCLTKGADNGWVLTKAAEPLRTRRPDEATAEELKFSEAKALGILTFKLPSLDYAVPGVKPAPLRGHKVQIKGLVYRQLDNDRITTRYLKSLSSSCTS